MRRAWAFVCFFTATAAEPSPTPGRPEIIPQLGHTKGVQAVCFSPDGRLIASASSDSRVKLWEVATGRELRTLVGHRAEVHFVAFSPDGRTLASAGHDNSVRLWDVETARLLRTLTGFPDDQFFDSVTFSPDGRLLAGAVQILNAATIRLWEVSTGNEVARFEGGSDSLAFSPDGRQLASASHYRTAWISRVPSGTTVRQLRGFNAAVRAAAWSPDGRLLATGDISSTVKLWDAASGQELLSLEAAGPFVESVAFSPNGRWVAAAVGAAPRSGHNVVQIWETESGQPVRALTGHTGRVHSVAFSPDGGLVASGAEDGTVRLWDARSLQEVRTLKGEVGSVLALAVSPDGRSFAVAGENQGLSLWDAATGQVVLALSGHEAAVTAVSFSPDGKLLASATSSIRDDKGRVWEVAAGREIRTLEMYEAAAFAPDGRLGWVQPSKQVGIGHSVRLEDPGGGGAAQRFAGDRNESIHCLAFSPDGRWMASGGRNGRGSVRIWDLASGREQPVLGTHRDAVRTLAFSPDSTLLASGGGPGGNMWEDWGPGGSATGAKDTTIRLWETRSGQLLRNLNGHLGTVWSIAFSPDGKTLASVSEDTTLRLWDVSTGREVHKLEGHTAAVRAVAFAASGRLVLSGSSDGSVRLWAAESGESLAMLLAPRPGRDWLVVTPEGLFDGSPAAWSQILWRFSPSLFDTAPVETFFNEFYRPGLLAELLEGRRSPPPRSIAQLDRRQPQIELSVADAGAEVRTRTVTVRIEAAEAPTERDRPLPGGVRDLRLFRNGSLVKLWRGDVLPAKAGKAVLEATVPIVAGGNRLSAYAFNRDNIKSADARQTVTGAENLKRAGTAYVLAVGINVYANPDYRLSYAVADARAFAEEIRAQQVKLGRFASVEVVPVLDREATKANILAALKRLAGTAAATPPGTPPALRKLRQAAPEDAVIVYFAGHGTASGPRFYLIPHDLGYVGKREAVDGAGLEAILSHGISDLELEQAFEPVDADELVLVIDACNSGQALEAEEKRRGPMNSRGLAQLAYEKGMHVLTAAQGYQAALEATQLGHGYLTYALVEEGLKTPAADTSPKDGRVVLREWLDYATLRVPQMQMELMEEARKLGREVAFVDGEQLVKELMKRTLQRPRVFYRRELEANPLTVAQPESRP